MSELCSECNNPALRWSIRNERYECQNCGSFLDVDYELIKSYFQKRDLLMWVGGRGYPELFDFVREAEDLGCCKRISGYPTDIRRGKSRVYLIHKNGHEEGGDVFGYFTIRGVEMIVEDNTHLSDVMRDRGVTSISMSQAMLEPERGCGFRLIDGAIYLVSEGDMTKLRDCARSSNLKGKIVLFDTPIHFEGKGWRGYKYVYGKKIEQNKPVDEWWAERNMDRMRRRNKKSKGERDDQRRTRIQTEAT